MTESNSQGNTSPQRKNVHDERAVKKDENFDFVTLKDEISRKIGIIQHAETIGLFNRGMQYAQLYQIQVAYRNKNESLLSFAPSFPAFCELIGMNYGTVKEHLGNMSYFGEAIATKLEQLNIPIRDIRAVKKLPSSYRTEVIDFIMTPDSASENVRDKIMYMVKENTSLRETIDQASIREKADLIDEKDKTASELDIARTYLSEEQKKSKEIRKKYKALMDSHKPEARVKAIQSLSEQIKTVIATISDADLTDSDPIFDAEIKNLRQLIQEASKIIGN